MQYRVAVINHDFKNCETGIGGWGWSLGEANVPRQFSTYSDADALAQDLAASSRTLGAWEFKVIDGPPFDLPQPRNRFHAKRQELSHDK